MTERLTMTVEEAAHALGIARGTAYEAVRSGELPSLKIGRRLLVPRARLLELVGADNGFPVDEKEVVDEMSERRATGGAIQARKRQRPGAVAAGPL